MSFIPSAHADLHKIILNERDQMHAHSDLTVMAAQLTVHKFEEQKYAMIIRNHLEPTRLASRFDEVVDVLEQTIDRMYIEVKTLEAQLPPTAA